MARKNAFERTMKWVERVGNKLPHPFWLFSILAFIVVLTSFVLSKMGLSVSFMGVTDGALVLKEVAVKNLLTWETYNRYMRTLTSVYMNYPPLGMLILMIMSVGFAEKVGLFSAMMRKMIIGAPLALVTFVVALVGVNSSIGFGAGVVFTMVVAAAMFKAIGLHPWIGIIAGYASANGGFTANFFITGVDALFSGVTTPIIEANGINAPGNPLINWYFIATATIFISLATVVVTKWFLAPYLNNGFEGQLDRSGSDLEQHKVTPAENKGLKASGIAVLVFFFLLFLMAWPEKSFLRNADGRFLPMSPLLDQVIPLLFLLFFIVGIVYGKASGSIKTMSDIPNSMQSSLDMAASYLVVSLPAALFVQLFSESQIATILAVNGAEFLKSLNLSGMPLFLLITLLSMFINLFITSSSGKWIMLAPFLVPMLAMLNISPAMTQVLYRIGDSTTNIISPVELNVPIALSLLQAYKVRESDEVGIGTLISMSLPYTIAFFITFYMLVAVWYYFDLPLGPGASIFLS